MKISWGHKILFTYLVFVVGMMCMVYLTTQQNRDLVSDNYYADELAFQKIIDESANTAALSAAVVVEKKIDQLKITMPQELNGVKSSGTWMLYYAADRKKDANGNFETAIGISSIIIPSNAQGLYTLILQWETAGKPYYFEQNIFL
ncbi:MAG: hypothetical protein RLZZ420_294 [Bacteroidota bacterium]|jgi:hypothetical protein